MSQAINFTDDDLKSAIISHWGKQGVTVNENTAQQLAQEVRGKLRESTMDELKLALSEMKMELSPSMASLRPSALVAISVLNENAKIFNLIKNADFGNMARNEVERFLTQLQQAAGLAGKSVKEQREKLTKEIHNTQRELGRVEQKIKSISDFDENSEVNKQEILNLISNESLQKITDREHQVLGNARASKDPESKKVGYTPEQIAELNKAFAPSQKDKDGNKVPLYTKNLPTISFNEELKQGRSNERLLWTRKRFAYERALGRQNSALYSKRLSQYRTYINILMHERLALSQSIASKQRLTIAAGNIAMQTMATEAIEHFHYDATKGKNPNYLKLKSELDKYVEALRQMEYDYLNSLKEDKVTDQDLDSVDQQIEQFLNSLSEGTEAETPVQLGSELSLFDPEYIFSEGRQGRENEEGEAAKHRQKSKLAPNDWSFKNVEQQAPEVAKEMANEPTTWKKGWAIFNWGDRLSDATKTDVGTILRQKISPKITQEVQLSPYATESDKEFVIESIDRFNRSGLNDSSKMNMASGPWNWAILWNLSKDKISKKTFISELLGKQYDEAKLPDGVKALVTEVYRQYPKVNSDAVRLAVAKNAGTPDWVLMYMAQHDRELETFVLNTLGKRGWKVKKTAEGNPEIYKGDWVWEKTRQSSIILSYREAQIAPAPPAVTPPASATAPAVPPQQFQQLVLDQRDLEEKNKQLDKKRQELQYRLEQMNTSMKQQPVATGQTTTPTQAGDNTNAVPGAITPPSIASGWKNLVFSWRNKIFGR